MKLSEPFLSLSLCQEKAWLRPAVSQALLEAMGPVFHLEGRMTDQTPHISQDPPGEALPTPPRRLLRYLQNTTFSLPS